MTDDVNKILSERKNSHGDFSDHALITANLKMSMHITAGWGRLIPVQSEALDMIAHKIGRILAGDPNFKDHWDDIAGYATLVANRCNPPQTAPITKSMSIPELKIGEERRCTDGSREMWTVKGWVKSGLSSEERQELNRIKDAAANEIGGSIKLDKMHCAQCDGCMRVDAAGYVMCQFKGCPNAGKKVL